MKSLIIGASALLISMNTLAFAHAATGDANEQLNTSKPVTTQTDTDLATKKQTDMQTEKVHHHRHGKKHSKLNENTEDSNTPAGTTEQNQK